VLDISFEAEHVMAMVICALKWDILPGNVLRILNVNVSSKVLWTKSKTSIG